MSTSQPNPPQYASAPQDQLPNLSSNYASFSKETRMFSDSLQSCVASDRLHSENRSKLHQDPHHGSTLRRSSRQVVQEPKQPDSAKVLYLRPLRSAESLLQFCSFDAAYIQSLRDGDPKTQEHFVTYFTELLQLKLRSRLHSPQAIEDVRQETFVRVLKALRIDGTLRQPDRLGAFVNTCCNHVLFEHYRASSRSDSLDDEGQPELAATGASALDIATANQTKVKVREILLEMPMRDRMLLKAVFLDERDRDEVCAQFNVDREYLRVLLFRAKQDFKVEYLKRNPVRTPVHPQAQKA